jgi:hypothetical protein
MLRYQVICYPEAFHNLPRSLKEQYVFQKFTRRVGLPVMLLIHTQ